MNNTLDNLCMGCFAQLSAPNMPCPVCGYTPPSDAEGQHRLNPRTVLSGKYMVGKALGEGGFGITYLGYDLNLDIKVAIKEFYPFGFVTRSSTMSTTVQPLAGEQGEFFLKGRERFVDEAKRLAKFRAFPGIVMVNDFFVENGTAYIVMEYVEGETLKSYMAQQGGRLPSDMILNMMKPVFQSLSQIHEEGLIHRDISPDNIMITYDGSMKLLDFGAAREFGEDGNKSLSVMLKHGYAPPEQYTSRGVQGPHTDVYALCATIYKAVTGETPESSMDRVMDDHLQPPSALGVALPYHVEAALMRGLAVKVADRWQTVGELYSALYNSQIHKASELAYHNSEFSDRQDVQQPVYVQRPAYDGQQNAAPTDVNVYPASPVTKPKKPMTAGKRGCIIAAAVGAVVVIALVVVLATRQGTPVDDIQSPASEPDTTLTLTADTGNVVSTTDEFDISDWHDIVALSAGSGHTVGLKPDGAVVAVGENEFGQCDISDWRDIIAISAGRQHTVGLKSNGTVVAVGNNEFGQCNVTDWRDIIAISAGWQQTVGLKSDGTVIAIGDNKIGQCDVSYWRDIIAISTGFERTVGLRTDGTIIANDYTTTYYDFSDWHDIVAISTRSAHIVGLKSDGTVITVGENEAGECDVSNWRDVVAIAAGTWHTVGLKLDGTVIAVGSNREGQCDVSDWRDIIAISAGPSCTIGLQATAGTFTPMPIPTLPGAGVVMPGLEDAAPTPEPAARGKVVFEGVVTYDEILYDDYGIPLGGLLEYHTFNATENSDGGYTCTVELFGEPYALMTTVKAELTAADGTKQSITIATDAWYDKGGVYGEIKPHSFTVPASMVASGDCKVLLTYTVDWAN